jgi:hypothetical protein
MAQPDLVIENKGRKIYQKKLEKEEDADTGVLDTFKPDTVGVSRYDYKVIPDQSVVRSVQEDPDKVTVTYTIRVINDSDDDDTFKIELKTLKPNANWVVQIKGKSPPFNLDVSAESEETLELEIVSDGAANPGDIAFGIVSAEDLDDSVSKDYVKGIVAVNIATYSDVLKEAELLALDEALFPSDAVYSSQDVIESYIKEESQKLYEDFTSKLDGIKFASLEVAKKFICRTIVLRLLEKASTYSLTGGLTYIRVIDRLKEELANEARNLFMEAI